MITKTVFCPHGEFSVANPAVTASRTAIERKPWLPPQTERDTSTAATAVAAYGCLSAEILSRIILVPFQYRSSSSNKDCRMHHRTDNRSRFPHSHWSSMPRTACNSSQLRTNNCHHIETDSNSMRSIVHSHLDPYSNWPPLEGVGGRRQPNLPGWRMRVARSLEGAGAG